MSLVAVNSSIILRWSFWASHTLAAKYTRSLTCETRRNVELNFVSVGKYMLFCSDLAPCFQGLSSHSFYPVPHGIELWDNSGKQRPDGVLSPGPHVQTEVWGVTVYSFQTVNKRRCVKYFCCCSEFTLRGLSGLR